MRTIIICMLMTLVGCAKTQTIQNEFEPNRTYKNTNVMEIIRQAAEAAPKSVRGEYVLNIQASGVHRDMLYLNTELDYRDPRCVTISISPQVFKILRKRHAEYATDYYIGKKVIVNGNARRVTIGVSPEGKPPWKYYYYQTHIYVSNLSQLSVLE